MFYIVAVAICCLECKSHYNCSIFAFDSVLVAYSLTFSVRLQFLLLKIFQFLAHDSIAYYIMLNELFAIARPSVCLSVRRVYHRKRLKLGL